MNHGWEKKRLGDVCDIYQPKTISTKDLVEGGEYDVFGANGIIGKYTSYNHEEPEVLLTCRGATCGTINVSNPKSWINGNAMVVHPTSEGLSKSYLRIALQAVDYTGVITGAAQPQITRISLSPVVIPIPPLEKQKQIVLELDKINEMLEVKRGQLKDLDMLSQSLFYEMFGEPIENPQGWETFHLRDLVKEKLSYGSGASGIPYDNKIRYIRITDIDERGNLKPEIASSPSEYNSKYMLKHGDILLARSGATVGKAFLYKKSIGPAIYAGYLIKVSIDMSILNSIYLYEFTKTAYYWNYISKSIRGAAQPNVNAQLYGNLSIPVPPLSLQNEFASKIEAIEEQKRVIESTISDLEVLLASRMDYWFND
ncbi:MAG: hypothetical protein HDR79_00185 [Bacteroides sp.]|nr:hypothetical protein [Bacteroides sp.]